MDKIRIAKDLVKIAKSLIAGEDSSAITAASIPVPSEQADMSYPSTNQVFFIVAYDGNPGTYASKFGITGTIDPSQDIRGQYKFGSPLSTAEIFMRKCRKMGIKPTQAAIQDFLGSSTPEFEVFDAANDFFDTDNFFRQLVSNQKPNLIFSTNLNDLQGFEYQCHRMQDIGYDKNNIHIIWVLPNVNENIETTSSYWDKADMLNAQQTIYMSMNYLLNKDINLIGKCIDGDIWVYFDDISIGIGKNRMQMKNVCECLKHSGQPPKPRETITAIWDRIRKSIPKYYYQNNDGTMTEQ